MSGSVTFARLVNFGAWGRNGRILQSGLYATVLDGDIVLEPVTSRNVVSSACSIRIPLSDRDAVIKLLKAL